MSERRACPEPATIAAFIDGTLAGDQTQSMSEHIASCDECLAEIGDAMPFVRKERESATHRSRAWSLGIAAAVAIVVIGGATFVSVFRVLGAPEAPRSVTQPFQVLWLLGVQVWWASQLD